MREKYLHSVGEAIQAISDLKGEEAFRFAEKVAHQMADCFDGGGKVLIAGNGGSLSDASHFAEELSGFYRTHRRPLAAIALTESAHITCVSNDLSFDAVFARWVEALGHEGDIFIAVTTSGNSKNLIQAALSARSKKMKVIGFLGKDGGALKELCDVYWIVKGFKYSDRIQEAHMTLIHIIIEMIEQLLFFGPHQRLSSEFYVQI